MKNFCLTSRCQQLLVIAFASSIVMLAGNSANAGIGSVQKKSLRAGFRLRASGHQEPFVVVCSDTDSGDSKTDTDDGGNADNRNGDPTGNENSNSSGTDDTDTDGDRDHHDIHNGLHHAEHNGGQHAEHHSEHNGGHHAEHHSGHHSGNDHDGDDD